MTWPPPLFTNFHTLLVSFWWWFNSVFALLTVTLEEATRRNLRSTHIETALYSTARYIPPGIQGPRKIGTVQYEVG